jgi:hypothetical protein
MKHEHRQLIRLAQAISESNRPRCEPARTRFPVNHWEEVLRLQERIEHALSRGWSAAARVLTRDLRNEIEGLERSLNGYLADLDVSAPESRFASAQEIFADLVALPGEFPEFDWDHKERTLTAVTAPISFDDVWLGPFAIELNWEGIYCPRHGCYRIIAQEPNPSSLDDDITHPHVQGEVLCEGEAAYAIRRSLSQGRLMDFFLLVRSVLATYSSTSPYVAIENWDGVRCEECDYTGAPFDLSRCARCDRRLCEGCCTSCSACESGCCYECRADCSVCEDLCCVDCLEPCSGCGCQVCPNCRDVNLKCEKCHESHESESHRPDAAIQPDRLGQAAVPA